MFKSLKFSLFALSHGTLHVSLCPENKVKISIADDGRVTYKNHKSLEKYSRIQPFEHARIQKHKLNIK